jgi:hypothetical protein
VARLASGTPFVIGRRKNGFVAIKLPTVDAANDGDLWLAAADLAAAKPWKQSAPAARSD